MVRATGFRVEGLEFKSSRVRARGLGFHRKGKGLGFGIPDLHLQAGKLDSTLRRNAVDPTPGSLNPLDSKDPMSPYVASLEDGPFWGPYCKAAK